MKTSQPFYRRFRGQLLRAAGVTAVVGPLVCAACTSEVVIEGDGDGGGTTNATATNGSGGAGSVTSTSSSGQGGSSISVTVSTVNSGVGGSTPITTACFDAINNSCPDLPDAPSAYGECTWDDFLWIEQWVSGPTLVEGRCCYEVVASQPCGVGRPFMDEAMALVARAERGASDWSTERGWTLDLPDELARELAEAWTHDALFEHASVASFARFSLELMAVGAPAELLEASQRAARDEIEHARRCFELASRFAGTPVHPGPFPVPPALTLRTDLAELAAATAAEGCIGETLAVAVAQAQLERATDPEVRAALSSIVEDEARHAELAWRTVAWAIRHGGQRVRSRVAEVFAHAAEYQLPIEGASDARLAAYGRLDARAIRDVQVRALIEVVMPCATGLLRHVEAGRRDLTTAHLAAV